MNLVNQETGIGLGLFPQRKHDSMTTLALHRDAIYFWSKWHWGRNERTVSVRLQFRFVGIFGVNRPSLDLFGVRGLH